MSHTRTCIEPPIDDTDYDSGDDRPALAVTVMLTEADETVRSATIELPAPADDVDLADALVRSTTALALLRDPRLHAALIARLAHWDRP